MKTNNLIKKLIFCKYKFSIDRKSDILIYTGWENVEIFKKTLGNYNLTFLHRKSYEINIVYLLIAIYYKILKKEKLAVSYFRAVIFFVKPKLFLTAYDNEELVYLIKNHFSIKTACIQISHHNDYMDMWGTFTRKRNLRVDHMFVYGNNYKKRFSSVIKSKFHNIGSFRNNSISKRNNKKKKENSISYISQFRDGWKYTGSFKEHGTYIPELIILKFLEQYCIKKNFTLKINLFSSPNLPGRRGKWYKEKTEINFFDKLKLKCKYKYIVPKDALGSYNNLICDNSQVVVTCDSNLGYELLCRDIKVVFLSIRDWDPNAKSGNFGWPGKYPKTGFFWTNINSNKIFERVINRVIKINSNFWKKKIKKYFSNIIIYDEKNKILKKELKKAIQ